MDDDEYKLVDTPLCRKIRRNRTFVLVHIYRGEADSDWTLVGGGGEPRSGGRLVRARLRAARRALVPAAYAR